jgi:hypothetical protein
MEEVVAMERVMPETRHESKKISCDQVTWIMRSLERFQAASCQSVMASLIPRAAQLATLLEIMEILGYDFQESAAARNALSQFRSFEILRGDE